MDIAIIGGGISGLTAATTLKNAGHHVTIFEKARGPGGRTSTRRTDHGSIDHGAQFFTIRDERFREFLNTEIGQKHYAQWQGKLGILQQDGTFKDDTDEPRYVGTPGMNALCKQLASTLNFQSARRVNTFRNQNEKWHLLDDAENDLGTFDWVISSAPPKQTAELYGTQSAMSDTLASIEMEPCVSVLLITKEKITLPYDGIKCNHPILGWAANNHSKPEREGHSLMFQSNYPWTQQHINKEPAWLGEQIIQAAEDTFNITLSQTDYNQAHRWLYAAPSQKWSIGYHIDREKQLAACGDWCLNGRVEGAFLSGLQVANALID